MTDTSYSKFFHSMVTVGIIFLVLFGLTLTVAPASASTVISDTAEFSDIVYTPSYTITASELNSLVADSGYTFSEVTLGSYHSFGYLYLNGEMYESSTGYNCENVAALAYTYMYPGHVSEAGPILLERVAELSQNCPGIVFRWFSEYVHPAGATGCSIYVFETQPAIALSGSSFDLTTTVTQSDSTGQYTISAAKSDSTSPYYYVLLSQKISSIDSSLTYEQEVELQSTTAVTAASKTIASSLPADYNENGDIGYYKYTLHYGSDSENIAKTYTWGSRFGSAEPILEFGSTNIIYGSSTSVEAWYASSSGPVAFVVSEGSSLDQSNMVVLEGSLTDSSVKLISDRFTLTPDRVGCWTFAILANGKIVKSVTVYCNAREITSGDFDFNYDYIESSKTYRVELTKNSLPLYLTVTGKVFGWLTVYSYSSESLTVKGQLEEDIVLTDLPAYWTGFGVDYKANVFPYGGGVKGNSWVWNWGKSDFVGEDGELLNPDKTGTQEDPVDFESLAPPPTVIPGYTTPDLESPSVSVTLPSSDALFDMVENFRLPSSLKEALNLISLEEYRSSLSLDSTHVLYGYQQGIFDLSDNTIGFVFGVLIILISIVAVIPKLLFVTFTDLIVWLSSAFESFYDWLVIPSEIFNLVIDLIPDEILSLALLLFAVDLIFIFFRFVIPGMISGSHALGDIVEKDEKMRRIEELGEETYNKFYGNKRRGS